MATNQLFRQGLGCPNCGEHRMRFIHSRTVCVKSVNGKPRYKRVYRCATCEHQYTPPPLSELPPVTQQPLSNLIKGVLYYTASGADTSVDMARGVVTAVATTIMAERNILLPEALRLIHVALPTDFRREAIPTGWLKDMEAEHVLAELSCPNCGEGDVDKLHLGEGPLEDYVLCSSCDQMYDIH